MPELRWALLSLCTFLLLEHQHEAKGPDLFRVWLSIIVGAEAAQQVRRRDAIAGHCRVVVSAELIQAWLPQMEAQRILDKPQPKTLLPAEEPELLRLQLPCAVSRCCLTHE